MDGKLFTKETKSLLKKVLDDAIPQHGIKELLSDIGIFGAVELIDYYGDKFVPDEYDPPLNSILTKALDGDYEGAKSEAASLLNKVIDLPYLDETSEEAVFQTGMSFLLKIITNWIDKKKAAEEGTNAGSGE